MSTQTVGIQGGGGESHPWERRSDESTPAWRAFRLFRDAGDVRTIDSVIDALDPNEKSARSFKSHQIRWRAWSAQFDWDARVTAYDGHMEQIRFKALEEAMRRKGELWARRGEEKREKAYLIAMAMMKKADAISRFPAARETIRNDQDGAVTIIEPVSLSQDVKAVRMLKDATEVATAQIVEALGLIQLGPGAQADPAERNKHFEAADRELEEWRRAVESRVLRPESTLNALNGPTTLSTVTASSTPPTTAGPSTA